MSGTKAPDGIHDWVFGLGMIALVVGFVIGSAISYASTSSYIGLLERQSEFYKTKFEYYFDGANQRRFIELCRGADGEIDVLFKDECRP